MGVTEDHDVKPDEDAVGLVWVGDARAHAAPLAPMVSVSFKEKVEPADV
jgi:hypothetical protein